MIWRARILGREGDLEHLARRFKCGHIVVLRDSDGFHLTGERFASLRDIESFRAEAREVLGWLSGVLATRRNSAVPLSLASMSHEDDDGGVTQFVTGAGGIASQEEFGEPTILVSGTPPPTTVTRIVQSPTLNSLKGMQRWQKPCAFGASVL